MAAEPGFFRRGPVYRQALDQIDIRIAVSGIRGKSSTVRRLHDAFHERGYDTFAKVTGDEPYTLYNGEKEPLMRAGSEVTLYENRRLITSAVDRLAARDLERDSVAIFENHAISEYTMRVFNETFLRPHIVVIPNIRTDHTDTLGPTRQDITRSFARSIPSGTHVICGEGNDVIYDYLAAELRPRDVTLARVTVPEQYRDLPGAESIFAINEVLREVGESPLPDGRVESMLNTLRPNWTILDDGSRVFNAAKVNEPESTEMFRRLLAGDGPETELVCPFVFLRGDRRGRTASFTEYINDLYDRDCIDRLHVAGENARTFARRVTPPATVHDSRRESPAVVVDAVLAEEQPVILMANTVHPFMRALVAELNARQETLLETADADARATTVSRHPDGAVAKGAGGGFDTDTEAETGVRSPDARVEVYLDRADDWRWRLVHKNGNILADGTRGRSSQEAVETVLDRVMELVAEAAVVEIGSVDDDFDGTGDDADIQFELYEDAAEEWRWRLRNTEASILADSGEGYASKGNARRGIKSVMRTLPSAVVELKP